MIMKYFKLFLCGIFILIFSPAFAKNADSKDFQAPVDDIFLISLGVLNNLNYKIEEIQSQSGYILFKTTRGEYLLWVSENNSSSSNVKIQKAKRNSPLSEVQNAVFQSISDNLNNVPKRID